MASSSMKSSLKIRQLKPSDVDCIRYIDESMEIEGWRPGLQDLECFFAFGPAAKLYLGELNGTLVASICSIKYDETYYVLGVYIVRKDYRDKGYGMEIFNYGLKEIPVSSNPSGYGVQSMVPKFRGIGFQSQWAVKRYDIDLAKALQILQKIPLIEEIQASNLDKVDRKALFNYDTAVFGYQRHKFLEKWLTIKGRHAKVARNNQGCIIGYASSRVAFVKSHGYKIGPLFADSLDIAMILLRALFKEVLNSGLSPSSSVLIDCPETNPEAETMMGLINGQFVGFNMAFMTRRGVPNGCFDKWFGVTSVEFG